MPLNIATFEALLDVPQKFATFWGTLIEMPLKVATFGALSDVPQKIATFWGIFIYVSKDYHIYITESTFWGTFRCASKDSYFWTLSDMPQKTCPLTRT
jgi:hypothetical protein